MLYVVMKLATSYAFKDMLVQMSLFLAQCKFSGNSFSSIIVEANKVFIMASGHMALIHDIVVA